MWKSSNVKFITASIWPTRSVNQKNGISQVHINFTFPVTFFSELKSPKLGIPILSARLGSWQGCCAIGKNSNAIDIAIQNSILLVIIGSLHISIILLNFLSILLRFSFSGRCGVFRVITFIGFSWSDFFIMIVFLPLSAFMSARCWFSFKNF